MQPEDYAMNLEQDPVTGTEEDYQRLVADMVTEETPALFAVVEDLDDRSDGRIAAWMLEFADRAEVITVDGDCGCACRPPRGRWPSSAGFPESPPGWSRPGAWMADVKENFCPQPVEEGFPSLTRQDPDRRVFHPQQAPALCTGTLREFGRLSTPPSTGRVDRRWHLS
jgi:hypothetical protein